MAASAIPPRIITAQQRTCLSLVSFNLLSLSYKELRFSCRHRSMPRQDKGQVHQILILNPDILNSGLRMGPAWAALSSSFPYARDRPDMPLSLSFSSMRNANNCSRLEKNQTAPWWMDLPGKHATRVSAAHPRATGGVCTSGCVSVADSHQSVSAVFSYASSLLRHRQGIVRVPSGVLCHGRLAWS